MIRKELLIKWCLCAFAIVSLYACKEDIDTSARYVFTDETVMSYLEKHDSAYSLYVNVLRMTPVSRIKEYEDTKVAQLLSARGNYTCFAPSNQAVQEYLDSMVVKGIIEVADLNLVANTKVRDSLCKVIVYNSIIDGGDVKEGYYLTVDFPVSNNVIELDRANMNEGRVNVKIDKKTGAILINDMPMDSKQKDIRTTNGVIHQMNKLIAPDDVPAGIYMQNLVNKWMDGKIEGKPIDPAEYKDQLVLARVLEACGLLDTLLAERDEVYERMVLTGELTNLEQMTKHGFAEGNTATLPQTRKYGFTIFNEGDDYWRTQDIDPEDDDLLAKMVKWITEKEMFSKIYEGDRISFGTDYGSEDNILNRWVTYHILPMRIEPGRLIIHDNELGYNINNPSNYTVPVYEYYTSFGKRRVIKLFESKESEGVFLNRFPNLDNDRFGDNTNHELSCDEDKVGCRVDKDNVELNAMDNCIVYHIDAPLGFTDHMRDCMAKERMRMDGMSLLPEAMTNNIRRNRRAEADVKYRHVYIPHSEGEKEGRKPYPYFKDLWLSTNTTFVYYNTYEKWCNLYEDEMKAVGKYEVMVTLPPVPRQTTYEVRYDVLANGNRGVVQPHFGHDKNNLPVTGIPVDLTLDPRNGAADQLLMGWKDDTDDEEINIEIDRSMRLNGFMKGSRQVSDRNGGSERDYGHRENSRRILTRLTMYPQYTYYLKLRSVLNSDKMEFYMDYIELCPKEVYDNPERPEDTW